MAQTINAHVEADSAFEFALGTGVYSRHVLGLHAQGRSIALTSPERKP